MKLIKGIPCSSSSGDRFPLLILHQNDRFGKDLCPAVAMALVSSMEERNNMREIEKEGNWAHM
ncbi:hypothetical protein PVAP13_6KG247800 [Panicum virgatum]|uniref:Uncharacterized protein n=1 Tax=Panicum virgatum TaxID=38727 RepID=A0A8T0RF85_PANVG|nr:hypothetical protein PVAP13_6KG247800 [Panicum virgatum]